MPETPEQIAAANASAKEEFRQSVLAGVAHAAEEEKKTTLVEPEESIQQPSVPLKERLHQWSIKARAGLRLIPEVLTMRDRAWENYAVRVIRNEPGLSPRLITTLVTEDPKKFFDDPRFREVLADKAGSNFNPVDDSAILRRSIMQAPNTSAARAQLESKLRVTAP
ncbi:hypothetical protein A2631_01225 [Candidatus Daviesbacteria bacterium RIFCSPHIGHO2_01_FULL_44_29]|uniref:Uncharacterized protein n=1 Tax=Candidatus Daviesbacteria bacterium RIFCSPHIGHO2_02_FULL_43_12 TaxID=1797776 RepID=A0A1F5KIE4_9BACT|nr:MAG: hypothetical protein A2631_01225 [Candidatus Daviesbacteria bacterium RIFCSPHIGHO2_01_FULL_44_29]OGE40358.1 MAG: hypothetical protein A3E86_01080 [Candidatus Daviesbacteria bacterium RIFCSPHIGHO2_12_FULL_47_45]OGE40706.1 MAG: hypothetical protein A3D25_05520 [Candidatus Daviesbacteria bacterium RIFCSPHIGHO2_02_FULL_43_12]OGE69797.1 MAG: hypothetical protein A3B55_05290 [Candidatus Daviesbacteria bacterium RIFCSPLOWO2_01_FULL_43_15]